MESPRSETHDRQIVKLHGCYDCRVHTISPKRPQWWKTTMDCLGKATASKRRPWTPRTRSTCDAHGRVMPTKSDVMWLGQQTPITSGVSPNNHRTAAIKAQVKKVLAYLKLHCKVFKLPQWYAVMTVHGYEWQLQLGAQREGERRKRWTQWLSVLSKLTMYELANSTALARGWPWERWTSWICIGCGLYQCTTTSWIRIN